MEKIAKGLVLTLIVAVLGIPLVGKILTASPGVIELRARIPENGGWSQDVIKAKVNDPLKLRLISDDVIHSFSVAKTDLPSVEVFPGKFIETELMFNEPGEYTFYCSRWCGINHWRMRGTIKIEGESLKTIETGELPAFLALDLDIDAPHQAVTIPANRPSADIGKELISQYPQFLEAPEEIWVASPEQFFIDKRSQISPETLTDEEVWDVVAWAINQEGPSGWLEQGRLLYRENCLACHSEDGQGTGVMVRNLPSMDHAKMGTEAVRPPDFRDPRVLLGASPALLEGKIIRGGMGTGMPYWGSIFTNVQIKSLVLYLYTFQFDLNEVP